MNRFSENPNLRELKPAEKIGKIGVNRIRLIEFGFEQMAKSWTDSRIRHLFVIRFSRQNDSILNLSDDREFSVLPMFKPILKSLLFEFGLNWSVLDSDCTSKLKGWNKMNRKRDEPEPYPHSINAYWPNKGFTFYSDDGV